MHRWTRSLIVAVSCLALAIPARAAAPGDLDTSFSGDGVKTVDYDGLEDTFYGAAVDGSSVATCGSTQGQATLTVLTGGGALDDGFAGDGRWRTNILGNDYSYLEACRFLPDGRLVAVGAATVNEDGDERMIVVVRKPNGLPDPNFSGDGLVVIDFPGLPNVYAYDLAVQPDGKIVVAGETFDNSVTPAAGWFAVARVKPNGQLDGTFSGDGKAKVDFHPGDDGVWKVVVQDDGRIVLAGWIWDDTDQNWNTGVARLKPNGTPDTTFSGDGKVEFDLIEDGNDYAIGMDVRPDGRIVLGVYGYDGSGNFRPRIVQLKPGGGLDGTFSGDGIRTGFAPGFDLQELLLSGAKILVAGSDDATDTARVMRLTSGGIPDDTFGTDGVADLGAIPGRVYDMALDARGRIVATGYTAQDGLVLRVLT
jgi:uncharacterized delta-60 repeat protein